MYTDQIVETCEVIETVLGATQYMKEIAYVYYRLLLHFYAAGRAHYLAASDESKGHKGAFSTKANKYK
jgi:hypothetical protein